MIPNLPVDENTKNAIKQLSASLKYLDGFKNRIPKETQDAFKEFSNALKIGENIRQESKFKNSTATETRPKTTDELILKALNQLVISSAENKGALIELAGILKNQLEQAKEEAKKAKKRDTEAAQENRKLMKITWSITIISGFVFVVLGAALPLIITNFL